MFVLISNKLSTILLWFGLWPAMKGHVVALSPLPALGWGGEWKEKGKTHGLG